MNLGNQNGKECNCMKLRQPTNVEKWYFTLIGTIIFVIVTNPMTYVFINATIGKLLKIKLSDKIGCPSMQGLMLHTLVFALLLRFSMN